MNVRLRLADLVQRLLNRLIRRRVGGDARPAFLDPNATYPSLLEIDRNVDAIQAELAHVLPVTDAVPTYHDADEAQRFISEPGESAWRTFFLHFYWADERFPHRAVCPRTVEIVERIPNVLQAFFSILEPKKSVPAHRGPGLHYLRYHTGLVVPANKPPSIRVKDRHHTWKEGESLFFDDSYEHEVTNDSETPRVVLIVDVLRPLPPHLHALNVFLRWLRTPAKRYHAELYERVRVDVPRSNGVAAAPKR